MTCEPARREARTALTEMTRLHDELTPLLLPIFGTGKPINPHSLEFEHIADLQAKEDEARQRYRAAWDAWIEAMRLHRDE